MPQAVSTVTTPADHALNAFHHLTDTTGWLGRAQAGLVFVLNTLTSGNMLWYPYAPDLPKLRMITAHLASLGDSTHWPRPCSDFGAALPWAMGRHSRGLRADGDLALTL